MLPSQSHPRREDTADQSTMLPGSAPVGKTIRIVTVEDERILAETLARWLKKIAPGFQIDGQANNARDGWELCLAKRPDLVLLDVGMPNGDGLTLAEKVREHLP